MSSSSPDPFADLSLPPDVQKAAEDVHTVMSAWIDGQVSSLKVDMTARAHAAAIKAANDVSAQLSSALTDTDAELGRIAAAVNNLKINFADQGLKDQADRLLKAIKDQQDAVAAQRQQFEQAGQFFGGVVQKAVMTGL